MVAYDYDLDENGEWQEVTLLSRRYSTAAKDYLCDRCSVRITPGQRYVREFFVSVGVPSTARRHFNCTQAAQ